MAQRGVLGGSSPRRRPLNGAPVLRLRPARPVLAPLLETLIVLDRAAFLCERAAAGGYGLELLVLPVFDPLLSPRTFALAAVKTSLQEPERAGLGGDRGLPGE